MTGLEWHCATSLYSLSSMLGKASRTDNQLFAKAFSSLSSSPPGVGTLASPVLLIRHLARCEPQGVLHEERKFP